MEDQTRERWYQLCGQVAVEEDRKKLLARMTEVNSLLKMRDQSRSPGIATFVLQVLFHRTLAAILIP